MDNYTTYRYPVHLNSKMLRGKETAILDISAGASFMSVGVTNWRRNEVQLWYLVNTETADTKTVEVMVLGTGHSNVSQEIMERMKFLGTVIDQGVEEVYHVFILKPYHPRLAMMAAIENSGPQTKAA